MGGGVSSARRALHTRFNDLIDIPEMDGEMIGLPALERLARVLLAE